MKTFLCGILIWTTAASAAAKVPGLRIVQLDLARQMETCAFLSNYIDRVSAVGYDTLQLYLEARVATKTFSLPEGECYTADQMKALVAYAAQKGLTVVPVVSMLGHAEQFFRSSELDACLESGGENARLGNGRDTFCLSNPATRRFLTDYVTELCAIFPGPYFHAGFDEAWNSGTCRICRPKEMVDENFSEAVLFAHALLARNGKRMWMWDDFFAFHPKAFARMPKDIVMMHWNYEPDVSAYGNRVNFAGRLREDSLAIYAARGYDAVPCWWYNPDNARSFIAYARRHKVFGTCHVQWEETISNFHGGALPRVIASALILDDPAAAQADDPYPEAVRRVYPSLAGAEVAAAVRLLEKASDTLALDVLLRSSLARSLGPVDPDPFSEKALFDDLLMRGKIACARTRLEKAEGLLGDPRRTPADVAAARSMLAPLVDDFSSWAERRAEQARLWRPGLKAPAHAESLRLRDRARERLETAAVATPDEKVLEIEFSYVDVYGIPRWRAMGRFGTAWRELGTGVWKPAPGTAAAYLKKVAFRSASMPDAVRLEQSGYGDAQVRFVSVVDRAGRVVPRAVSETKGRVRDAANVLRDDYSAATFGTFGFLDAYYDKIQETAVSSVTVELAPEVLKSL